MTAIACISIAMLGLNLLGQDRAAWTPATLPAQSGYQRAVDPELKPMESSYGMDQTPRMPMLGEIAPAFRAQTTQGTVNFPADYKGKWVIFFSHPAVFTPVCTTEVMTLAAMKNQFDALDCELLGLSLDSNSSHIAWLRTMKNIKYRNINGVTVSFPIIADVKMDVAARYGMIHPAVSGTATVRAVFIIDPQGRIRAIEYYPLQAGRSFKELRRLLIALQTADTNKIATPADWEPGDDVTLPVPCNCDQVTQRFGDAGKDYYCLDWFLCFRKMPKDQLKLPPTAETAPAISQTSR